MPAKSAKPDRYLVDRIGTPDPESTQYYVLDVVNDWQAREALAQLGNKYRQRGHTVKADECFVVLNETLPAHRDVMERRNPKQKRSSRRENARP